MQNDQQQALEALITALPLYAEEGNFGETVSETELCERLSQVGYPAPELLLGWVRRLFEALCLLERHPLAQGNWRFISFPASLVGRSLLETLACPKQTLFEAHYWEQGSHRPEPEAEKQRRILEELESARERFHPSGAARPIRTVHVASALIRFDDRFLLLHREDQSRSEGRDYVLPGGRVNLSDIRSDLSPDAALRDLMGLDSALAEAAFPTTLARELEEELGLLPEHYRASRWKTLEPYKMREGTRNNWALTQYRIVLFTVELKPEGEFRIVRREAEQGEKLVWFSIDDLDRGKTVEGHGAFIEALTETFGSGFREELGRIPDSRPDRRSREQGEEWELPSKPGEDFRVGKTGKEGPVVLELSTPAWELLHLLAWHHLGLPVELTESTVKCLGGGWIQILDPALETAANALAETLGRERRTWLDRAPEADFIRLATPPHTVYLCPEHYRYRLDESEGGNLILQLQKIETNWGTLCARTVRVPLTPRNFEAFQLLQNGQDPRSDRRFEGADIEREIRRQLGPQRREIGLRKLIYTEKKQLRMVSIPLDDQLR